MRRHVALLLFGSQLLFACAGIRGSDTDVTASRGPALPVASITPEVARAPASVVPCTHYVAPYGSDEAPGSEARPWASFQHAADSAEAGDAVCFRGGNYPTEETHLTRSGTPQAEITFIASVGEVPLLDGEGSSAELLILDRGSSYLRISGFTLRNFTVWGIELSGDNRYVQLDHLDIGGGEAGIHFAYAESSESPPAEGPVEHITLEDSVVHGSQYSAVDCTPGPCNHMVVRRVEIFNTGLTGEALYGSDGLEFARGYPVLVEDCYVHDNGGDGLTAGEPHAYQQHPCLQC